MNIKNNFKKKRVILVSIILFSFLSIIVLSCAPVNIRCVDDTTGPTQEYSTIQSAVDAAQPGDTILVYPGIYSEEVKSSVAGTAANRIIIKAENNATQTTNHSAKTIFDASNTNLTAFYINESYYTIDGFYFLNYLNNANQSIIEVRVGGGTGLILQNNIFENSTQDKESPNSKSNNVYIADAVNLTVRLNKFLGSEKNVGGQYPVHTSIKIFNTTNSLVELNEVTKYTSPGGAIIRDTNLNLVVRYNYIHDMIPLSYMGYNNSFIIGRALENLSLHNNLFINAFINTTVVYIWSYAIIAKRKTIGNKEFNNTVINFFNPITSNSSNISNSTPADTPSFELQDNVQLGDAEYVLGFIASENTSIPYNFSFYIHDNIYYNLSNLSYMLENNSNVGTGEILSNFTPIDQYYLTVLNYPDKGANLDIRTWPYTLGVSSVYISDNDITAPVISSVTNASLTNESEQINFATDEPANHTIYYGTTLALSNSITNTSFLLSHFQTLINLHPNTTYYYNITACDASNNCNISETYSFLTNTSPVPDLTSPTQTQHSNYSINNESAVVNSTTDEGANSTIRYGTTLSLSSSQNNLFFNLYRYFSLTELQPNTTYYYNLSYYDSSNNPSVYGPYNFITLLSPDTTSPDISNILNYSITNETATINWTTDELANATIYYGSSLSLSSVSSSSSRSLIHSVLLTSLAENTTYYYNLSSCDSNGNCKINGTFSFKTNITLTLNTTPPVISNISNFSITNETATVSFNTDELSNTTLDYGTALSLSFKLTNSSYTLSNVFTLTSLLSNTTYYYNVSACNIYDNCTVQGTYNFITLTYNPLLFIVDWSEWWSNETTNFSLYTPIQLSNLENIVFSNFYGRIDFLNNISLTLSRDLRNRISITNNQILVNSTLIPEFNKSASIIFRNVSMAHPIVKKNGIDCDATICQSVLYDITSKTYSFTSSGFSTYNLVEQCTDGIQNSGESGVDCGGVCGSCPSPPPAYGGSSSTSGSSGVSGVSVAGGATQESSNKIEMIWVELFKETIVWNITNFEITKVSFKSNNEEKMARLTIEILGEKPVKTLPAEHPYKYLAITSDKLNMTAATLRFKVNKTWLNEKGYDSSEITLSRYSSELLFPRKERDILKTEGIWVNIPTKRLSSDENYTYYESLTSGFGYLVIRSKSISQKNTVQFPKENNKNTTNKTETLQNYSQQNSENNLEQKNASENKSGIFSTILFGFLAVILTGTLIFVFVRFGPEIFSKFKIKKSNRFNKGKNKNLSEKSKETQLIEYIIKEEHLNLSDLKIEQILLQFGWNRNLIENGIKKARAIDYIRNQRVKSVKDEDIKQKLLSVGWDEVLVDECFELSKKIF